MAAGALVRPAQPGARIHGARRTYFATPEIYFRKAIDNSRLVKVDDPVRKREMRMLTIALGALFALVMVYAWQHFSAIEYGYRIEALNSKRDALIDSNRQLRLEQARLRDPERIDAIAKQMGLQSTEVGQVVRLDPADNAAEGADMARANQGVTIQATP